MSVIVLGSLALLVLFVCALVWRTRAKVSKPSPTQQQQQQHLERISVLGRGIVVEGTLRCDDPLRIDGTFRGSVEATEPLTIGEPGHVIGDVHARELFIAGEIDGDLSAERLGLHATARVNGDIECGAISVDNGAWFHGRVTMKREEADADAHATA